MPSRTCGSLLVLLAAASFTAAAAAPPDLTGIWSMPRGERPELTVNGPGDFAKTAPFTPLARRKLAEYHALVDPTGDTPGAHCLTYGMPQAILLGGSYPVEFVQRAEQLTIVYEIYNYVRRVFLDGRHIEPRDILPSRGGVSRGRWEGETLVVETTDLQESIDQATAHGANARIVERYTPSVRDGLRRLRVEVTIHDPEFYTEPARLEREYTELPGGRMLEYNCTEAAWEQHLEKLRETRR